MTDRTGQSRPGKPGMAKRRGCKIILGQKAPEPQKNGDSQGVNRRRIYNLKILTLHFTRGKLVLRKVYGANYQVLEYLYSNI